MSRHSHRPQGFQRTDRIADFIQRELSGIIRRDMKDPRLGMVTIQDVKVSKDLGYADVYFTLLDDTGDAPANAEKVLTHAGGFLRTSLSKILTSRTTPRLRFHYDTLPERASEMESLLRRVREEDRQATAPNQTDDDNSTNVEED